MNKVKNWMVRLKPSFQKKIFQELIDNEGGSINAGRSLCTPASSIRGYKNLYSKSVPEEIINKLIRKKITSSSKVKEETLETFAKEDLVNSLLDKGREKRRNQLRKWKEKIPSICKIIENGWINFEKWFLSYQKLINFGARKFNYIKTEKSYIEISYETHSGKQKKNFVLKFPRRIKLDKHFAYFFGLWCGDRAGGKRFGICNQNASIIHLTETFLIKNYQKIEKILYISNKLSLPSIKYDKKFAHSGIKGWALSVHSTNGIFSSFFHYLQDNFEEFLKFFPDIFSFFAGLFDAEGNISLHNKSFRWACRNQRFVRIYTHLLRDEGLYNGYDGKCIICYNKEKFYREIFPYLKHDKKVNYASFLCRGEGTPPKEIHKILDYSKCQPNKTAKEIAKALKKGNIYSELKLLSDFGFVSYDGYPHKVRLTPRGLESLGDIKL
jgi:hypothetical protein